MIASPRLAFFAILLTAGAIAWARERRDLALHKPVQISSVRIGDPAGVVNGLVEWGSYAVHTKSEGPAWIVIDLEDRRRLGQVVVYGRGDGFFVASPAMTVDVSTDGKSFGHELRCDPIVTQASPCRVDLGGAAARYVRVKHPTHLVLSEVEVFEP